MQNNKRYTGNEPRNIFGNVVIPDPPFAKAGENSNKQEYKDGAGKTQPAPNTTLDDGCPKYATDGLTVDWFATHPRNN